MMAIGAMPADEVLFVLSPWRALVLSYPDYPGQEPGTGPHEGLHRGGHRMAHSLNVGTLSYARAVRLLLTPGGRACLPMTPRQLS